MPVSSTTLNANELQKSLLTLMQAIEPYLVNVPGKGDRDTAGEYPEALLHCKALESEEFKHAKVLMRVWNLAARLQDMLSHTKARYIKVSVAEKIHEDINFIRRNLEALSTPEATENLTQEAFLESGLTATAIETLRKLIEVDFSKRFTLRFNGLVKLNAAVKSCHNYTKDVSFDLISNLEEKESRPYTLSEEKKKFYELINELYPIASRSYEKACIRDALIEIAEKEERAKLLHVNQLLQQEKEGYKKFLLDFIYEREYKKFRMKVDQLLPKQDDLEEFRKVRNNTYHAANRLSVKITKFKSQSKLHTATLIRALMKSREQIEMAEKGFSNDNSHLSYRRFAKHLRDRPSRKSRALGIAMAIFMGIVILCGIAMIASGVGAVAGVFTTAVAGTLLINAGIGLTSFGAVGFFSYGVKRVCQKHKENGMSRSMLESEKEMIELNRMKRSEPGNIVPESSDIDADNHSATDSVPRLRVCA